MSRPEISVNVGDGIAAERPPGLPCMSEPHWLVAFLSHSHRERLSQHSRKTEVKAVAVSLKCVFPLMARSIAEMSLRVNLPGQFDNNINV